jgi:ribose/xylose/arabinose/galactoside ABC-type transport system permease subunit
MTQENIRNSAPGVSRSDDLLALLGKLAPVIFLVALIAMFGLANERFFSLRNIFNILNEVSIFGLMAVGVTFVILTAGIDLSVGAILAFSGMVCAVVLNGGTSGSFDLSGGTGGGYGIFFAFLAALFFGAACGFVQGSAIAYLGVPAFVVTLGGMSAFRGATLVLSGGGPIPTPDDTLRWIGQARLFDIIPIPVIVFLIVAVISHAILSYTRFGRDVYAVGGNPEAARLAGVNVRRTLLGVYLISGLLAGLAGFLLNARLGSAEAVAGVGFELRVIASVVIGGTSLFGGIGGIWGTAIGALLIGVLLNGLVMLNVNVYWQQIIVGVIIVFAVAFNIFAKGGKSHG